MLSQGRWSLGGRCLPPSVGDAFFAFICIINLGTSLTFSLSAQRRIWWRTGGGLRWSLFIQLEARVSLDSSVTQAAARRSCSESAGRMTLAAIVLWCSAETSSCTAETAGTETKTPLKRRLPGRSAMGDAGAAGVPVVRALAWGCWCLELLTPDLALDLLRRWQGRLVLFPCGSVKRSRGDPCHLCDANCRQVLGEAASAISADPGPAPLSVSPVHDNLRLQGIINRQNWKRIPRQLSFWPACAISDCVFLQAFSFPVFVSLYSSGALHLASVCQNRILNWEIPFFELERKIMVVLPMLPETEVESFFF